MEKLKIKQKTIFTLHFIIFIVLIHYAFAASDYGTGTYGLGVYGQESCGDAVCDISETCSSCRGDCGICLEDSSGGGVAAILKISNPSSSNSWGLISEGQTASMNVRNPEISITNIELTVGIDVKNAEIKVVKIPEKETPSPNGGKTYQYLQINKNIDDSAIKTIVIRFKVSGSWLDENNIDESQVVLKAYKNNQWAELPTIRLSNRITGSVIASPSDLGFFAKLWDGIKVFFKSIPKITGFATAGQFIEYEATAESAGYFAVSQKERIAQQPQIEAPASTCIEAWGCSDWGGCINGRQTRACLDSSSCGTSYGKPQSERDCQVEVASTSQSSKSGFSGWGWVLGIVALSSVAFYSTKYLITRKRKEIPIKTEPIKKETAIEKKEISKTKPQIIINRGSPVNLSPYIASLHEYTRKQMEKGFDLDVIKEKMISSGWPKDLVESEFRKIK